MDAATGSGQPRIGWADEAIDFAIEVAPDGTPSLARLTADRSRRTTGPGRRPASAPPNAAPRLPLADILVLGEGRSWSGSRYAESVVGRRLRYAGHEEVREGQWYQLRVDLADPVTGLRAEVSYQVLTGQGVLRSWVRLTHGGIRPVTVQSATSFLAEDVAGATRDGDLADLDLFWADNDWLAEGRWQRRALQDALPDLNRSVHGAGARGQIGLTSEGTWSSGMYLPMGAVVDRRSGQAWAWQIEHNGAWHWQVGEVDGGLYLALLGPTDAQHQWSRTLAPGESFSTVPVAVAVSDDGFDGAVARLTAIRRASRRPHQDHHQLPVIFNDYMNTLKGDPTTEKLLPLVEAAAEAGAEYFCIDAGWYAEADEGWWDTVGAWRPSSTRFPGGLTEVLDRIRASGMVPGLWLEPEVIGMHSPAAERLPADAFFQRGGERVVEHSRYHLDLRHPAAVKHLDEVIDYLVTDLGIGYLKLDYNINGGPGTDVGGISPGAGLLEHNRAHLKWLDAVLSRHPALTLENCASGGMRGDYAMLSRCQLQSTSDQQDFLRYPAIAASWPAGIAPEQAAIWAYPQPEFTDAEIAFTLCTALLGRLQLSGHVNQMSPAQQSLVAEAVTVYKKIRADVAQATPFWPLGLPGWTDSLIALGMRAPAATYVAVWRRGRLAGPGPDDGAGTAVLPVRHLSGADVAPEVLYPGQSAAGIRWAAADGTLAVTLPEAPSACLIQLR